MGIIETAYDMYTREQDDTLSESDLSPSSYKPGALLILEDFDAIRAFLSHHFERRGFEIYSAAKTHNGLMLARAILPEIVVIDYDLAGEDALFATRAIRATVPGATIVLMGGPATDDLRRRAIEAGATYFVGEGYDLEQIDELLGPIKQRAA